MPAPSDTAPDAPRAGLERSGGPRCSHKPLRAPGHTGLSPEGASTHLQQKKAQPWKTDLNSDALHPQVTRERDDRGDPGPGRGQRFGVCLSTCSGDSCSDEGDCRAPGPWPATGSRWPHSGPLCGLCHRPRVVTRRETGGHGPAGHGRRPGAGVGWVAAGCETAGVQRAPWVRTVGGRRGATSSPLVWLKAVWWACQGAPQRPVWGPSPRSLRPAGRPAAAPTCSVQHMSHERTRLRLDAWSQLSLEMGEAVAPVDWDVWGGESHSRAPGLGSGPLCMRHAVPHQ